MKARLAIAILLLAALPAQAKMVRAYIGTYTYAQGRGSVPGTRGEGIYLAAFDTDSGKLGAPRLVARSPSPSWVTVDPVHGLLYAANEAGGGDAGVSAFRIDRSTGDLAPIGKVAVAGPVHLALAPGGGWLVAASFSGTLNLISLKPDGAPDAVVQTIRMDGTPKSSQVTQPPGNQWVTARDQTRVHGSFFHPDGLHLVMNDYGLDELVVFALENGQLRQMSRNAQFPGSATRHSAWNAKGDLLYSISEQDSMVTVNGFDPATGKLAERQRISALPKNYQGSAAAAEIVLSKDGRNLYVTNRFYNSIAHFRVGAKGLLAYGGDTMTAANHPRMLVIDPSGRWLLAGGQNNDTIAIYRIGANGTPQPVGTTAAPTPVSMAFLDE